MDRLRLLRRKAPAPALRGRTGGICARSACLGLIALAWLSAGRARADVPALLPIQGYLTEKAGKPLDGTHDITFRLYPNAIGDSPFHEETISVVVLGGHFNAYLGDNSSTPLNLSALRDNAKVFLGIEVEDDGEGVPRLQLGSTAFAAQSAYCSDATSLGGKAATEYAPIVHMHSAADIMAYADLLDEGYLNGDDSNDLLTLGQGDSRYASKAQTHDAAAIDNGTLSTERFSCYNDLGAEGYLDGDASGDLSTQAQGDMRWVKRNENNSVSSNMLADVRMDKTTAPIGAASVSQTVVNNAYMFPSPSYTADSGGICVVTAVARVYVSGALASNSSFFAYAAVDTNNGMNQSIIGNFAYGAPATGSSYYANSSASGQVEVAAGKTYQFGCYVSTANTFSNQSYTCMTTWVCN